MSLPLGGYFDLNGRWVASGSHLSHRIGVDVDIDRWFTTFTGVSTHMTAGEVDDFKDAMVATEFGRVLVEHPIHFRLNEEDIDKYLGSAP